MSQQDRYVTEETFLLQHERCSNAIKSEVAKVALLLKELEDDLKEDHAELECVRRRLNGVNGTPGINEEVRSLQRTIEEHSKFIDKVDKLMWKILGGVIASTVAGGGIVVGAMKVFELLFSKQ